MLCVLLCGDKYVLMQWLLKLFYFLSIRSGTIKRTPCVVHTLQLVVNMIQKEPPIKKAVDKLRHLVNLFRKSSVATGRLLQKCELILIKDCPTRWSSTYLMMSRALQVKDHVASVAESMTWDNLQTSEWQKLAILKDLLLPFAEHTKVLESDTNSLCLVVPALLDLRGHLSEFSQTHAGSYKSAANLALKMSVNMESRFGLFLNVRDERFSPLAAAACFVEPNLSAEVFIDNEDEGIADLLKQAEDYIIRSVTPRIREEEENDGEEEAENRQAVTAPLPKRPKFRFFCPSRPARPRNPRASIRQEIQKYKDTLVLQAEAADDDQEDQEKESETGIEFWCSQSDTVFKLLKPLALDLLAMPASQAFAERVFSVTGDLSTGRRNRARTTLERSAFLKLNKA